MKKRVLSVICAMTMAVALLAGCGSSTETSTATTAEETAADSAEEETAASEETVESTETADASDVDMSGIKIGLIIPGTVNDQGWSQIAYEALVLAEKNGAEIGYSENVQSTDYETTMRGYAEGGFNIVVAHGSQFWDVATTVAPDYPDTQFIVSSTSDGNGTNCAGVLASGHELGFLNGIVMATLSKTGKIAAVAGTEMSSLTMWAAGIQAGAAYVNPDVECNITYTGSLEDAVKAKEAAIALIEDGCDVLSQNANEAGQGVILACDEKGVMDVGAVSDQSSVGESVVISVPQDLTSALYAAICKYATDGIFGDGVEVTYVDGANYFTDYTGKYADSVTDEQKAAIDAIVADLVAGKIDVDELAAKYEE